MAESPVFFDSVWKKFYRGERHDSLRDLIPALISRPWRRRDELADQEFWAIRDMSFAVNAGEAMGIVGANGAGKSTVLKLLTKILRPTKGQCHVKGRVGALIEVASSFHGDLTGRENVYLQGAIMGMKRSETARRFDEIVDFAEVGAFIDTPVKRYSNGMNARLGFAIAAHLDPDVLIIDEVLSVGDLAFQDRCLQRMQDFKKAGVAVVFVSHNPTTVAALCDTTMIIAKGRARCLGPTEAALENYLQLSHDAADADSSPVVFERMVVTDAHDRVITGCPSQTVVRVRTRVRVGTAVQSLRFGLAVYQTATNVCAYETDSAWLGLEPGPFRSGDRVDVVFTINAQLARGHYLLEVCAKSGDNTLARSHPPMFLQVDEQTTISGVADLGATCVVRPAPARQDLHLLEAPGAKRRS